MLSEYDNTVFVTSDGMDLIEDMWFQEVGTTCQLHVKEINFLRTLFHIMATRIEN